MLKEAKSFLESEKNRLEQELVEGEDKISELNNTREVDRARIVELETVISATENKVDDPHPIVFCSINFCDYFWLFRLLR